MTYILSAVAIFLEIHFSSPVGSNWSLGRRPVNDVILAQPFDCNPMLRSYIPTAACSRFSIKPELDGCQYRMYWSTWPMHVTNVILLLSPNRSMQMHRSIGALLLSYLLLNQHDHSIPFLLRQYPRDHGFLGAGDTTKSPYFCLLFFFGTQFLSFMSTSSYIVPLLHWHHLHIPYPLPISVQLHHSAFRWKRPTNGDRSFGKTVVMTERDQVADHLCLPNV